MLRAGGARKPGSGGRRGGAAQGLAGRAALFEWGCVPSGVMLGRSGYRPLPLGDFDRFQQSSLGFLGSQKGCLFPEPGGVQTEAGEWPPSTADPGGTAGIPRRELAASQRSAALALAL